MKKFSVEFCRTMIQAVCIEVEAENEDQAQELALDKLDDVRSGAGDLDWELRDGGTEVVMITPAE